VYVCVCVCVCVCVSVSVSVSAATPRQWTITLCVSSTAAAVYLSSMVLRVRRYPHVHVCHRLFFCVYVPRLLRKCDMSRSYVLHDWFIRAT